MRQADGTYFVTAEELAAFYDSGQKYWYMRDDGSTDLYSDELIITHGWPIYLMDRDEKWFAKWNGNYEKAVEDELNPHLLKNFEDLITVGDWPKDHNE